MKLPIGSALYNPETKESYPWLGTCAAKVVGVQFQPAKKHPEEQRKPRPFHILAELELADVPRAESPLLVPLEYLRPKPNDIYELMARVGTEIRLHIWTKNGDGYITTLAPDDR